MKQSFDLRPSPSEHRTQNTERPDQNNTDDGTNLSYVTIWYYLCVPLAVQQIACNFWHGSFAHVFQLKKESNVSTSFFFSRYPTNMNSRLCVFCCLLIRASLVSSLSGHYEKGLHQKTRRHFNRALAFAGVPGFQLSFSESWNANAMDTTTSGTVNSEPSNAKAIQQVAYKSLRLPIREFGVTVPVAMWYPVDDFNVPQSNNNAQVRYDHRISVKRIGQLLAGWNFIPEFASRSFAFQPTSSKSLLDGEEVPFPASPKVVFLAHGYLGSRFDLSHIAEELASKGFVCISAEYPESLAASYSRMEGLDRAVINTELLLYVQDNLRPTSYAAIGHSLGCGTVLRMGDASWTRVLIAGRAPEASSSPLLFISSTNDCTVRFGGPLMIPDGYTLLEESNIPSQIPAISALVFDRPDAPNHISYLSENVNEAMVSFLAPLLPVAQALSIPVLDFDKYQQSRDSVQTANILKPVISDFLSQQTTAVVKQPQ